MLRRNADLSERGTATFLGVAQFIERLQVITVECRTTYCSRRRWDEVCRLHLDAYDHATTKIADLDDLVAQAATPFESVITRLMTIVGIGRLAASMCGDSPGSVGRG